MILEWIFIANMNISVRLAMVFFPFDQLTYDNRGKLFIKAQSFPMGGSKFI